MKPYINSILAAGVLTALCGCEKDNPFNEGTEEGRLDCKALTVDYINRENTVRASNGVNLGDFTVDFVNTATGETVRSFLYSEMPEVVALPIGNYRAEATYGDNPVAEWEAPYYLGNTTFNIESNKITDNVEPITCRLSNIKVTIDFNDNGLGNIGEDAKVVVDAGEEGSLTFAKGETKAGYFRYVEGSTTLTATFSGTIDGNYVEGESKAYDNVQSGNFYKISFSIHNAENTEPGDVTGTVTVDGTITVIDQNETVDPNDTDRDYEQDDMRPVEKDPENPDNPNEPVDPVDPDDNRPKVTAGEGGLVIAATNNVSDLTACKFTVTSSHDDGFTGFTVDIESPSLTPEELATVGLASHLDLIEPGELAEPLGNLGFPINIKGWKEANFDITTFLGLLQALGAGEHKFILTVTDGNGTTTEWFSLKID